jgi:hypothetical protein
LRKNVNFLAREDITACRVLCTGEKGIVPADGAPNREGVGTPYHFKVGDKEAAIMQLDITAEFGGFQQLLAAFCKHDQ